jgi:hypothetical protein
MAPDTSVAFEAVGLGRVEDRLASARAFGARSGHNISMRLGHRFLEHPVARLASLCLASPIELPALVMSRRPWAA